MASIDNLSREIARNLRLYADDVQDVLNQTILDNAKLGVRLLRQSSPKNTGKYAKGWASKKDGKGGYIIYNKDRYRLTHLLENGHALVNGGRTRAQKHIAPVRDEIANNIEQQIARELR